MKHEPEQSAFPCTAGYPEYSGLSKRLWLAGMVAPGLLKGEFLYADVAFAAIKIADAILAEDAKGK